MDSKVCPMDFLNTAISPAGPSLPFVPKGLMKSKVYPIDSFTLPLVLLNLVHPITFVPNGLMESKVCPIGSFKTAFSPACPSHHFCF